MFIVGTAGHIDHGKTTLTGFLTGVDTDRLKEEKQRGISIELGFAPLDLPDGRRVGLVDVPGHEKFVHHMIAGATGVDVLMLVIAADEGVMPQTREHLAICELLGINTGMVVLAKADLVEDDWLEMVTEDIQSQLVGSFLEDAPVLAFGAGWDQPALQSFRSSFMSVLEDLLNRTIRRGEHRPLVLPVDRAFSIKGFGTVITGTVVSGQLTASEELRMLPAGQSCRVRGLEVHGRKVDQSTAGTRTAVNLLDLEVGQVHRGDCLVHPGVLGTTRKLVLDLRTVSGLEQPLKARFDALLHTGTTYVPAAVRLPDSAPLGPEKRGLAFCRLESPVLVLPGMHAVLRSFSPVADFGHTIGGGTILSATAPRSSSSNLDRLRSLRDGDGAERMEAAIDLTGLSGLPEEALSAHIDLDPQPMQAALEQVLSSDRILRISLGPERSPLLLHRRPVQKAFDRVKERLGAFHAEQPRKTGMSREELRSQLPMLEDPRLLGGLCDLWIDAGLVEGDVQEIRLPGHAPQLSASFRNLAEDLERRVSEGGRTPPLITHLVEAVREKPRMVHDALAWLEQEERLVRISPDLYMAAPVLKQLRSDLVAWLEEHETITTQQFKDLTGLSRKYLIPLAEYFDRARVTRRTGDATRRLRR